MSVINGGILPNSFSKFNGMVVLQDSPNNLAEKLVGFDWSAFFGFPEIQDFLSAIILYPFNLAMVGHRGTQGMLGANNDALSGTAGGVDVYNFLHSEYGPGFHLGQKYFKVSSYDDFEPYTKVDVWLPYYGRINLPISKIANRYVNILLFVDYNTGNAQYVIATSYDKVVLSEPPFIFGDDLDQFGMIEIIDTEEFILGYKLPIGRAGYNDYLRDVAVGTVKTVAAIAGIALGNPAAAAAVVTTEKVKKVNKATGRLKTVKKGEKVREPKDADAYNTQKRISGLSSVAAHTLDSLQLLDTQGSVSNTNNPLLMHNTSNEVMFITTRAILGAYTPGFMRQYGRPLCSSVTLNMVGGYTQISSIRLSDGGFSQATKEELDEIENLMLSGVILPPPG